MNKNDFDEIKLKPCPFCGGYATYSWTIPMFSEEIKWFAVCLSCQNRSVARKTKEDAAERWNRRKTE